MTENSSPRTRNVTVACAQMACSWDLPIGVAICWDQWFPEAARAMALLGAELLFYPSAIGTAPAYGLDMALPWQPDLYGPLLTHDGGLPWRIRAAG